MTFTAPNGFRKRKLFLKGPFPTPVEGVQSRERAIKLIYVINLLWSKTLELTFRETRLSQKMVSFVQMNRFLRSNLGTWDLYMYCVTLRTTMFSRRFADSVGMVRYWRFSKLAIGNPQLCGH